MQSKLLMGRTGTDTDDHYPIHKLAMKHQMDEHLQTGCIPALRQLHVAQVARLELFHGTLRSTAVPSYVPAAPINGSQAPCLNTPFLCAVLSFLLYGRCAHHRELIYVYFQ